MYTYNKYLIVSEVRNVSVHSYLVVNDKHCMEIIINNNFKRGRACMLRNK